MILTFFSIVKERSVKLLRNAYKQSSFLPMLGKYKLPGYEFPSAQMPEVIFPVPSLMDHIPYKPKKEGEIFGHNDEEPECLQASQGTPKYYVTS